jgi:hypothetical protein
VAERRRLLLAFTTSVQYTSPLLREIVSHPKLDVGTADCSLQSAEPCTDPDFGAEVVWDALLLTKYTSVNIVNRSGLQG